MDTLACIPQRTVPSVYCLGCRIPQDNLVIGHGGGEAIGVSAAPDRGEAATGDTGKSTDPDSGEDPDGGAGSTTAVDPEPAGSVCGGWVPRARSCDDMVGVEDLDGGTAWTEPSEHRIPRVIRLRVLSPEQGDQPRIMECLPWGTHEMSSVYHRFWTGYSRTCSCINHR